MLEDTLGLTEEDISHQHGLRTHATSSRRASCSGGEYEVAFLLRPTPDRAGAGHRRGRRDDAAEVDLLLPQAPPAACCSTRLTEPATRRDSWPEHLAERAAASKSPRPGAGPPIIAFAGCSSCAAMRTNIGTDAPEGHAGVCERPGSARARAAVDPHDPRASARCACQLVLHLAREPVRLLGHERALHRP